MDTVETASRKVKQMGRQIESSMGNLKNMMSSISLVGDAKHFQEGKGKFDELRTKLDSKSTKEKLDAMKTLVAVTSIHSTVIRCRDVSELFPAVVKNVVVESMEIKKLVYMYVIHYAATNPNLALLSISSFQKDMASPNPLVRAKALHAMSCMRVSSVAHLIILQLKNAIKDSSSYVRRTAAHVLPTVLVLDSKFKVDLIAMLTTLLTDDDVYVLSGALYAFNILCGDRWDLIHSNYRKICHLLADMDEYGQLVALQILQRYCRNQFKSPFIKEKRTEEGDDDESKDADDETKRDDGDSDDDELLKSLKMKGLDDDDDDFVELDPDHKLLIASCKNLIFSMNSQVVLSVVSLLYYCAPNNECLDAIRALIQFVNYSKREICYVILANISTMASERSDLFAGFYKDFYIKSIEAGFIKELKLDILSKIASEGNINHILHEFEAYAKDPDIKFRCSTIEAMGRCCSMIPDVAEKTMSLLMSLLSPSNQSPDVVASSVVVIRQIIQRNPSNYEKSMIKLLKLLQKTNVPAARCAIVWIIGEYRQYISDYAPDALRILAKKFVHEALEVKVQILNLAVKVYLADPKKVILLFKYILDLCKYDQNYDLRDKARMIRCIFFQKKKKKGDPLSPSPINADIQRQLRTKMQEMFLSEKKVPEIESPFKERDRFVMNTLSHMVLHSVGDSYQPLEDFPEIPPDNADKRTPAESSDTAWKRTLSGTDNKKTPKGEDGFFDSDVVEEYSTESETDSEDTDGSDSDTDSEDSDDSDGSDVSDSETDSEDEDDSDDSEDDDDSEEESEQERKKKKQREAAQRKKQQEEKLKAEAKKKKKAKQESETESDEDEDSEEEEEEETESSSVEIADILVANVKDSKGKDDKKETETDDDTSAKKKKKKQVVAVKTVVSAEESSEDESDEEEEVMVNTKGKKKGKDKKDKGKKKEEKSKSKPKEKAQAVDLLGDLFGDTSTKSTTQTAAAAPTSGGGGSGGGDTFDMFDMLSGGGGGGAAAAAAPPKKAVANDEDEEEDKEEEDEPVKKSKKKGKEETKKSKKSKDKGKKSKKKKQESSDEESGWSDTDGDDEEEEEVVVQKGKKKKSKSPPKAAEPAEEEEEKQRAQQQDTKKQKAKERSDQLSDLFSSVMGNDVNITPANNMDLMGGNDILFGASADSLMKKQETNVGFKGELLNHTHTAGLQIDYEFVRQQSRYGVRFNQIRLIFLNKWDQKMKGISLSPHNLDKSQQDYHDIFDGGIAELDAGEKKVDYIHVQFGKTSEMRFDINVEEGTNKKRYTAKIKGIPGELMRPNTSYSMDEFIKIKKSSGAMSERNLNCDLASLDEAAKQVLKTFNIGIVNSAGTTKKFDMNEQRYFAGYLLADDSDVLIALEKQSNGKIMCTIHCTEFMLIDAISEVARQCLASKK